jgi:DNA-binding transcriptional ArsR family regulator
MVTTQLDITKVLKIVNHPIRKRIIELLGSKGPLTWKEISTEIGVGTGSLYYHIDALEGIVARDDSKRYLLTPIGLEVYRYLDNASPQEASVLAKRIADRSRGGLIENILAPRPALHYLSSTRPKVFLSLILFACIGIGASVYSGNEIILYSFSPLNNPALSIGSFLVSVLIVAVLAYLITFLAFKVTPDPLVLASGSAVSFLPIISLAVGLRALQNGRLLGPLANGTVLTGILVVFQAWSLVILGASMSVASGLRMEKVLIVGLVVLYASIILLFLVGKGTLAPGLGVTFFPFGTHSL